MNKIRLSNRTENHQRAAEFGGLLDWLSRKGLSEEMRYEMRARHNLHLQISKLRSWKIKVCLQIHSINYRHGRFSLLKY